MTTPNEPPVYTITSASRGLSEQQPDRTRRYLFSMSVRTVCVIGAIFIPGWPRWVLIAGAVLLPYVAVVLANAGRENDDPGELGVTEAYAPRLGTDSRPGGLPTA